SMTCHWRVTSPGLGLYVRTEAFSSLVGAKHGARAAGPWTGPATGTTTSQTTGGSPGGSKRRAALEPATRASPPPLSGDREGNRDRKPADSPHDHQNG